MVRWVSTPAITRGLGYAPPSRLRWLIRNEGRDVTPPETQRRTVLSSQPGRWCHDQFAVRVHLQPKPTLFKVYGHCHRSDWQQWAALKLDELRHGLW